MRLFRPEVGTIISGIFEGVNWNINEIEVEHSRYVDVLLDRFVKFRSGILNLDEVVENNFESLDILWRCCAREIFQVFLRGISNVEDCTNEGRAKMQVDFQQL